MEVSSAVTVGFNKKQEVYASSSKKRRQQTTYLLFFFFCWLPVWLFTFHWKENLMPKKVLLFSQVFAKENKHLQFLQPENHFTVTRCKWQAACRRNFLRIYRESSSISSMPLMCW
ncbi:unnamed protein product [Sphagnum jensenii]|uniref:Uncharacterized protein n=1 Tax=Sphagnum jensenii TaxID=128206 RepID=A0ABP1ACX9_9BRYO